METDDRIYWHPELGTWENFPFNALEYKGKIENGTVDLEENEDDEAHSLL